MSICTKQNYKREHTKLFRKVLITKINMTPPSFTRYQLLLAEDGQWGGVLPDGSITGMIGMVARHEVHFAINEITITG